MSDYEKIFQENYDNLNPEQRQAVDTLDGPVAVVAGPGAGKTQLLSMRVANIIKSTDTPPSAILCLTFTESASFNMRERLSKIIGIKQAYQIPIHTFHSFTNEIINSYPEYFFEGLQRNPADEIISKQVLTEVFQSLPKSDPLSSFHPDSGWSYIKAAMSKIKSLKKEGISPDEFLSIVESDYKYTSYISEDKLDEINSSLTIIKGLKKDSKDKLQEELENFQSILEFGKDYKCEIQEKLNLKSYKEFFLSEFLKARQELEDKLGEGGKFSIKEINDWIRKFFKKNPDIGDDPRLFLKDFMKYKKYKSLATVYKKYIELMKSKKYYDFEDMILEVVYALEKNSALKYELQEKFLYILVDEFQDTNGLQMRLISNLYDLQITEGKPNLMIVGDDDQSVYKFQGASIENILNFDKNFKEVAKISLIYNYRSVPEIVDFSCKIVDNIEMRLSKVSNFNKKIKSARV